MSGFPIPLLDSLARRRLGRTAQVEALPPQLARYDFNPHVGFRRPFVHAYYSERRDLRLGSEAPALRRAMEELLAAGADPELVEALTLEDLAITPEIVEVELGGIPITAALAAPASKPKKAAVAYVDAGPEQSVFVSFARQSAAQAPRQTQTSAPVPSPARLTAFTYMLEFSAGGLGEHVSVAIPEIGLKYMTFGGTGNVLSDSMALNRVILTGTARVVLHHEQPVAPGGTQYAGHAMLSYVPLAKA